MSKKLVIIGASGHGKVISDSALKNGYEIVGFLDDNESLQEICGFPVLGSIKTVCDYKEDCEFVIAIGNLIHPSAVLGMQVQVGEGTVVMANAVINPCACVGKHCIINSGAIVEHDNALADYVHVSPNATLAGTVCVGASTHIGVGACVKNNVTITEHVVIGAGAAVVKDITEAGVYVGVPARRIR